MAGVRYQSFPLPTFPYLAAAQASPQKGLADIKGQTGDREKLGGAVPEPGGSPGAGALAAAAGAAPARICFPHSLCVACWKISIKTPWRRIVATRFPCCLPFRPGWSGTANSGQDNSIFKVYAFKLCIIGISWPPETFLQRLMHGLAEAGMEVTIACPRKPDAAWLAHPEFPGFPWMATMVRCRSSASFGKDVLACSSLRTGGEVTVG